MTNSTPSATKTFHSGMGMRQRGRKWGRIKCRTEGWGCATVILERTTLHDRLGGTGQSRHGGAGRGMR
jgi:hypothetical protein